MDGDEGRDRAGSGIPVRIPVRPVQRLRMKMCAGVVCADEGSTAGE
jgi:hypothetical protein